LERLGQKLIFASQDRLASSFTLDSFLVTCNRGLYCCNVCTNRNWWLHVTRNGSL